jgi:hypothetical protein
VLLQILSGFGIKFWYTQSVFSAKGPIQMGKGSACLTFRCHLTLRLQSIKVAEIVYIGKAIGRLDLYFSALRKREH